MLKYYYNMKLIKELTNKEVGLKNKKVSEYRVRKAARAVVFAKDGKVAILHASKNGYHKIPGGGIESGEDIRTALAREIYEETGCVAVVKDEIGIILEYRDTIKLLQINYCFVAYVKKYGEPHFTKSERDEGFKLEWFTVNEAIKKFQKDDLSMYGAKFMSTRDSLFLKEAKKIVEKK
jgi:8-oxo-dGTP pyrophosphatase MutT (NUDIX family)